MYVADIFLPHTLPPTKNVEVFFFKPLKRASQEYNARQPQTSTILISSINIKEGNKLISEPFIFFTLVFFPMHLLICKEIKKNIKMYFMSLLVNKHC